MLGGRDGKKPQTSRLGSHLFNRLKSAISHEISPYMIFPHIILYCIILYDIVFLYYLYHIIYYIVLYRIISFYRILNLFLYNYLYVYIVFSCCHAPRRATSKGEAIHRSNDGLGRILHDRDHLRQLGAVSETMGFTTVDIRNHWFYHGFCHNWFKKNVSASSFSKFCLIVLRSCFLEFASNLIKYGGVLTVFKS